MEETTNGNGATAKIPEVTDPAAYPGWKEPETHTLPSGAVFLLRKPQIRKMIARGQIPNPLMDVINGVFMDRDQRELEAEAEAKGMTEDELLEERHIQAEADLADPSKPPPIPGLPDELKDEDELTVEMIYGFRDVIAWATIVAPRVEIAPPVNGPLTASGALSYEAIDEEDVQYIIQFANGNFDVIATFPADAERPDPGPDGGDVLDPAEPVAGAPV